MSCFHPLHAFQVGVTESGKPKYQIESGSVFRIPLRKFNSRLKYVNSQGQSLWNNNFVEIPCGKCIGCRIDYSKDWANRCMLESKQYINNAFITLTYDDNNLHKVKTADRNTGESIIQGTLVPNDLTKFMKDLRKYYSYHYDHENIRFFACGEYGSKTFRPHYHLIVFNLPIFDLVPFFKNKEGDQIFLSETIQKIWGKGLVSIGEVTWNSAAYTARYVMKKIKGPCSKDYYQNLNVVPEFVRMSRRPGIARDFYENNKDLIYSSDEIFTVNSKGKVITAKPSKYFDRLFDLDSPEAMKAIKEQRKLASELSEQVRLKKINMSKNEYLESKEATILKRIEKLKREIC